MIEINPESQVSSNNVFEDKLNALVLGVGGAGAKIVNTLSLSACEGLEYIVLDSDVQSLRQVTHCETRQIGKKKYFAVLEPKGQPGGGSINC